MRRIVNSTYVSLDGVIEHLEQWHFDYFDDDGMRKYVASTTLDKVDWNNSALIEGDLVEEVAKIKEEPGEDILMYGFGPVGETLLQNGLLDELRLWVHPVVAGVGEPGDMLLRQKNTARLRLLDTKAFESGVVVLSYGPAGND